ncbi:MAG: acetyltransferase, partial [Acidobacteriales bacterium]|nr:acetyltransferase [Terriglobales bacterium]
MQVIGLGAGGHASVVIDILQTAEDCELVGLLDANPTSWGKTVLGVPVLGGDDKLPELRAQGVTHAFIGVGSIGDTTPRRQLYEKLCQQGFELVNAIHPQAIVARSAQMGQGATIMAGCILNPGVWLGVNVVVNTGSVVEHDCQIGDHVFIGPGVRLGGSVEIEVGAHIGIGATILQNIRIGEKAIVGAGA